MPLDLKTVGQTTAVHTLAYDWKTLATYALGVGAKKDELAYLYEGTPDGMKVLPTFAVIPAQAAVFESLSATGGDLAMIVHGGQTVRVRGQIAESGTLETTGTMRAIYDLKKFAQVIIDTKTTQADKLVYETTWSIIFRGAGNFGGPRPVSEDTPSVPKDRPADFRIEESTSPEQALLYRLSGDLNPLHADPAVSRRGRSSTACARSATWGGRPCATQRRATRRKFASSRRSSAARFGPQTRSSSRASISVTTSSRSPPA